jgi:hypothetical protein
MYDFMTFFDICVRNVGRIHKFACNENMSMEVKT